MDAQGMVSLKPSPRGRLSKRGFPSPGPAPRTGLVVLADELTVESAGTPEVVLEVLSFKGRELGLKVAQKVMGWRLVSDSMTQTWVDEEGELTGYYNGRPFSPYRDRNALVEVWLRVKALGLETIYADQLVRLLSEGSVGPEVDSWAVHTCSPESACRAALLAVQIAE